MEYRLSKLTPEDMMKRIENMEKQIKLIQK